MEENQLSQENLVSNSEPETISDNSKEDTNSQNQNSKSEEGKSEDSSELILGKFKSTEDLTKAYQQLEKLQGSQSSELGALRSKVAENGRFNENMKLLERVYENQSLLQEACKKHSDYFYDPSFRELAINAFLAFGENTDFDKLVNLVESYVSARIFAHEKTKLAKTETENAREKMKFEKNETSSTTPVRKSIQQMTPKELDKLLDELI